MFTDQAWEQIGRSLDLSARELQIVRGVFDDRIESAIAEDLGISAHTVHTHFDRLHRKLGVATRTGLVLSITRQYLELIAPPQNPLQFPIFSQQSAAPASARAR
jgi:ATP/maltotriose-dependent transcriptional regulator MalT